MDDDNVQKLPRELKEAILNADVLELKRLLEVTPAAISERFRFDVKTTGKDRTYEASLIGATLRLGGASHDVLKLLVQLKGSLETCTSFAAGFQKLRWSGEPIHDAISTGNADLCDCLVKLRADPCSRSSLGDMPGATTLWQASFYGSAEIVCFLLEKGAQKELEVTSPWQDNTSQKLTPLHVAARTGNFDVVKVLVEAKAKFDARELLVNGESTPLRDAIDHSHLKVVKYLVAVGATIPRRALFEQNNEVCIHAVAKGLKDAPVNKLRACLEPIDWLALFLETPGKAPLAILNAIFRLRDMKYFDSIHKQRWHANIASFIRDANKDINISLGCDYDVFTDSYSSRESLAEEGDRLIDRLGLEDYERMNCDPGEDEVETYSGELSVRSIKERAVTRNLPMTASMSSSSTWNGANVGSAKASAEVLQCVVPDIYGTEHVLYAIAYGPSADIFDDPGCKAIITYAFAKNWNAVQINQARNLIIAILFALITFLLERKCTAQSLSGTDVTPLPNQTNLTHNASSLHHEETFLCSESDSTVDNVRSILLAVLLLVMLISVQIECLVMKGMNMIGKADVYFKSLETAVDWFRIFLSFMVCLYLLSNAEAWDRPQMWFKIAIAATAFFRWARVITTLSVYEAVGPSVDSILVAFWSAGPFLLVVFLMYIGFVVCYYALGLGEYSDFGKNLLVSMLRMYRLGFLGDLEDKSWNRSDTDELYYGEANAIMLFASLVMSVVMMNIFIGILSAKYEKATHTQHRGFLRTRARFALRMHVKNRARQALIKSFCCSTCSRRVKVRDAHESGRVGQYLWYVRRLERRDRTERKLEVMGRDLKSMKEEVEEFVESLNNFQRSKSGLAEGAISSLSTPNYTSQTHTR